MQCTKCSQLVIRPDQTLAFFSDYSRPYECPRCKHVDYHFAKPLDVAFVKKPTPAPIAAIIHQHSVNAMRQAAAVAMSKGVILPHPSGAHYNPYHPNFNPPPSLVIQTAAAANNRALSTSSNSSSMATTPSPPPVASLRRSPPPLVNIHVPPPPLINIPPPPSAVSGYQQQINRFQFHHHQMQQQQGHGPLQAMNHGIAALAGGAPPAQRRHCTGLLGDVQHQMSSLAIVAES